MVAKGMVGVLTSRFKRSAAIPRWLTLALLCAFACAPVAAQSLYKYRDGNGQWQFSDRPPEDAAAVGKIERKELFPSHLKPTLTLERRQTDEGVLVLVNNTYACAVQVVLELKDTRNVAAQTQRALNVVVPARGVTEVLRITPQDVEADFTFRIAYSYMAGDPEAVHEASAPYRVPFAIGKKYRVTQAYPSRITHADPASHYAIDVALPVGTAIYAAREGTVIEIAYDSYSGGTDATDIEKANVVRIGHDDGTLAVYAHLAWNSIRVRPGQRVERGEYLADSGNTGFSSGPHLHFAVQRNAGLRLDSLPISFRGPAASAVIAKSGEDLTAY